MEKVEICKESDSCKLKKMTVQIKIQVNNSLWVIKIDMFLHILEIKIVLGKTKKNK